MNDLNNMLANFQVSAANRRAECRKLAAQQRAEQNTGGECPQYDRAIALKVDTLEEEAAAWQTKAEYAAKGLLYVDPMMWDSRWIQIFMF